MLIYTHQNGLLVENAKNILEHAGIACETKNTTLQSGFGELSGIDTWPEVWLLDANDTERAKVIIESLNTASDESKIWRCAQCGEQNEASFDSCWHCQTAAP